MGLGSDAPVLVAVDFSEGADAAFEWALDLVRACGAPLLVLHVVHDPLDEPGSYATPRGDEIEPVEEIAERRLARYLEEKRAAHPELRGEIAMRSVLAVGLPVTRILEVSKREGAQLVVMGSKGRTALADVLLGSKVERVAHLSPISVAVIKGGQS